MAVKPRGYSGTQIALHWIVAGLVIFQLLGHEGIEAVWRAYRRGEATPDATQAANLHVVAGLLILAFTLWRLWLKTRRGVPAFPDSEPRLARLAGQATHGLLYAVLILMPLGGAAAWFGGVEVAADLHALGKYLLVPLVALHLVGVLAHFFVFKTDVPARMLISDDQG